MKNLLNSLVLCGVILLCITSCGDKGKAFGDPQRPTQQFINTLDLTSSFFNDADFIFGCLYEFQKEGRITKLCARIPDDEIVTMLLWDLSDTTIVATTNLSTVTGDMTCGSSIDFEVLAGSRYAVTFRTNDYFTYDDGGGSIFPATFGDVKILGYGTFVMPVGNPFPNQFFNDHLSGVVDLVYEPLID